MWIEEQKFILFLVDQKGMEIVRIQNIFYP